eukprot:scaffold5689_cov73-Isochrysis_galbana.AAC.2
MGQRRPAGRCHRRPAAPRHPRRSAPGWRVARPAAALAACLGPARGAARAAGRGRAWQAARRDRLQCAGRGPRAAPRRPAGWSRPAYCAPPAAQASSSLCATGWCRARLGRAGGGEHAREAGSQAGRTSRNGRAGWWRGHGDVRHA